MTSQSFKSLSSLPAAYVAVLELVSNAGFVVGLNVTLRGPEYLLSTYPDAWQEEYERKNYMFVDPMVYWSMTRTGACRWSEATFSNTTPVFKRARHYGLAYGATLSTTEGGKRSLLSLARHDRELTDEELGQALKILDQLAAATFSAKLSIEETDTLRLAANGLAQKEIAATLNVAEATVKARLTKAKDKLGAKNTTHAVTIALSEKLI